MGCSRNRRRRPRSRRRWSSRARSSRRCCRRTRARRARTHVQRDGRRDLWAARATGGEGLAREGDGARARGPAGDAAAEHEIGVLAHTFNVMADEIYGLLAQQAEKASLEKEMELAREVQQAMLPPNTRSACSHTRST